MSHLLGLGPGVTSALGNLTPSVFVSSRVGNYQSSPWVGPLLSQMWVK